jgi:hypothetical protein
VTASPLLRRLRRLAAVACFACLAAGCRATFVEPAHPPSAVHSRWNHFFLLGAIGHAEIDARELCAPGRVRSIETYGTVPTTLLTVVTAGLYAPRKVEVTCDAG